MKRGYVEALKLPLLAFLRVPNSYLPEAGSYSARTEANNLESCCANFVEWNKELKYLTVNVRQIIIFNILCGPDLR